MFECLSCGAIHKEPVLTREQAIKRIRDLRKGVGLDHLIKPCGINNKHMVATLMIGAETELMAIFDIKEEEL